MSTFHAPKPEIVHSHQMSELEKLADRLADLDVCYMAIVDELRRSQGQLKTEVADLVDRVRDIADEVMAVDSSSEEIGDDCSSLFLDVQDAAAIAKVREDRQKKINFTLGVSVIALTVAHLIAWFGGAIY